LHPIGPLEHLDSQEEETRADYEHENVERPPKNRPHISQPLGALLQAIPGEVILDQGPFVLRGYSGNVSNKDVRSEEDQGDEK